MYNFEPRIPADHVMQLIGILRGTIEKERGDVLMLCGATLGEAGALLKGGLLVTMVEPSDDIEGQIDLLEAHLLGSMVESACKEDDSLEVVEPTFDISPWIPIIIEIVRLIMKNRQ